MKIIITGARQQGKSTAAFLLREALEGLGVKVEIKGPSCEKWTRKRQDSYLRHSKWKVLANGAEPLLIEVTDS